ncbi:MAG: MYG1 family protein [Patescibacteria group bacterium]
MKIITHSGHFHPDELLAVAALLLKYPESEVVRSREEKIIESGDIVVDVGQTYDTKTLKFDHHQSEGAGVRENGIPYASFGLIWKEFGEELASGKEEAAIIEEKLVMPADAGDNGIHIYTPLFEGVNPYTIGDYFDSFIDGADTLDDLNMAFFKAIPNAQELLEREIRAAKRAVSGWEKVRKIYDESRDKRIITLPGSISWKQVLVPTEAQFIISPRPDGKWNAKGVPKTVHSFEVKKPFPKNWSGLKDGFLADISGVADAFFCHKALFMAVAGTKEGAIKLAELALNA